MAFWMMLGRSFFAIALGVAILFYPDKARPLLGNFIGGFWIAGSLLSLRWGFAHDKSKLLTIVVAATGVLAGLAVLTRSITGRWVSMDYISAVVGIVAILTGLLHMTGHMQVRASSISRFTRSGLILGIFEVMLGAILLSTEWQQRPLFNFIAIAWALVGGIVLFFDALAMRKEAKVQEEVGAAAET